MNTYKTEVIEHGLWYYFNGHQPKCAECNQPTVKLLSGFDQPNVVALTCSTCNCQFVVTRTKKARPTKHV